MASLLPLREAFADFTSIELTELGIWILEGSLEGACFAPCLGAT